MTISNLNKQSLVQQTLHRMASENGSNDELVNKKNQLTKIDSPPPGDPPVMGGYGLSSDEVALIKKELAAIKVRVKELKNKYELRNIKDLSCEDQAVYNGIKALNNLDTFSEDSYKLIEIFNTQDGDERYALIDLARRSTDGDFYKLNDNEEYIKNKFSLLTSLFIRPITSLFGEREKSKLSKRVLGDIQGKVLYELTVRKDFRVFDALIKELNKSKRKSGKTVTLGKLLSSFNASFLGQDLKNANFGMSADMLYFNFKGDRVLQNTNLENVQAPQSIWGARNSIARPFNISGLNCRNIMLGGADLFKIIAIKTDMANAYLNYSDFSGGDLESVILENATACQSNFASANLTNADMKKAVFRGAYFNEANMSNANLENANLENANLSGSILIGANLMDADLRGAIFDENTNLQGANTSGMRIGPVMASALLRRGQLSSGQYYAINSIESQ